MESWPSTETTYTNLCNQQSDLIRNGSPVVVTQQELRLQDLIEDEIATLQANLSERRGNVLTAIIHGAEVEPGDFMVVITETICGSNRTKRLHICEQGDDHAE